MRQACEGLLAPVAETMIDLLSRVEPEYQERVRHNVILSGGSGLISGLGAALLAALAEVGGGKVRVVKDPVFVGSDGGRRSPSTPPKAIGRSSRGKRRRTPAAAGAGRRRSADRLRRFPAKAPRAPRRPSALGSIREEGVPR
jgi:hypothetical protein